MNPAIKFTGMILLISILISLISANIELFLPSIHQARDTELGIDTYSPASHSKITIEHVHRYNYFCAPDPFSNQNIVKGTILPPRLLFYPNKGYTDENESDNQEKKV